ncbi:Nucleoporin 160kD [Carabus blaptoides fortunei]
MDLESIKKEFEVASARLRLARCNAKTLANQFTTPGELVTMLTNMGIFKCALGLCKTFRIPYDTVFDSLAKMCVRLTMKENLNAWNWLVENDLADLSMVDSSPATVCWNLLQMLLEEYEEPHLTVIHKVHRTR